MNCKNDLTPGYASKEMLGYLPWDFMDQRPYKIADLTAGEGDLLDAVRGYYKGSQSHEYYFAEVDPDRAAVCADKGFKNVGGFPESNFWNVDQQFDIIVANYPFHSHQNIGMIIKNFYDHLTEDGHLYVFIPAEWEEYHPVPEMNTDIKDLYPFFFMKWVGSVLGEVYPIEKPKDIELKSDDCTRDLVLLHLEKAYE